MRTQEDSNNERGRMRDKNERIKYDSEYLRMKQGMGLGMGLERENKHSLLI